MFTQHTSTTPVAAEIDREELEEASDSEKMMLNNSSHPPLCLNCRKPVNLDGPVSRLLSVQKLLLFQTYADQLNVTQSPRIPTWWDFCDEDLPFCESCFQAVKQLRQLTRQLDLVQRNIRQIITVFKIKILSSQSPRFPASYHRHRDSIFRNLAVADFLPALSLPRVKIEPQQKGCSESDNRVKIEELNASSTLQSSDPFFEVAVRLVKDSNSFGSGESDLDSHPKIKHQRSTRLAELLKRQHDARLQNSVSSPSNSKSYKKRTEKRDGRAFIGGIELLKENGQYKCGQRQVIRQKHSEPAQRMTPWHKTQEELGMENPDSEAAADSNIGVGFTSATESNSNNASTGRQRWTEKTANGREFVRGIEMLTLENEKVKCADCNHILHKKNFPDHVKYLHLGFKHSYKKYNRKKRVEMRPSEAKNPNSRRGRRRVVGIEEPPQVQLLENIGIGENGSAESENNVNANPSTNTDPPPIGTYQKWTERVNGKVFVRGIEMIRLDDGRVQCGGCDVILNREKYFATHVQFLHLGIRRRGMEHRNERTREPFQIQTLPDGTLSIGGIALIQDGRTWICGHCNHKLKKKGNMAYHIRTHLGVKTIWKRKIKEPKTPLIAPLSYGNWVKGKSAVATNGKKYFEGVEIIRQASGFSCGECSKAYRSQSSLMNHIRYRHLAYEKRPACEICNKRFATLSILRSHTLIHSEERTFTCHECGASFKTAGPMRDHIRRIHEKRRLDQCEHCGKEFYSRKDCNKHRLTHSK